MAVNHHLGVSVVVALVNVFGCGERHYADRQAQRARQHGRQLHKENGIPFPWTVAEFSRMIVAAESSRTQGRDLRFYCGFASKADPTTWTNSDPRREADLRNATCR